MRAFGIGLAAALILAAFTPTAVNITATAAGSAGTPAITKDARDKGMAAAPGLVQGAGLDCQVADARFIGVNADPKTKAKTSFYELACAGNEGVILSEAADKTYQVFTCMEVAEPQADGKPSPLRCALPGNADPKAGLIPYITKAGTPCTLEKARALGHSATMSIFEVACTGTAGYILTTSAPPRLDKEAAMNPCVMYDPAGNVKCEFSDRAAQLAVADRLLQASGKPCAVKDRRFVGVSVKKEFLYEIACENGNGVIVVQDTNGAYARTIDCVNSDLCQLTDARAAKTEQAGLYTRLAQKAGFNCDVKTYAPFATNLPGKEVVELVCNNRPDGGVGIFAASSSVPSVVYDCAHAELMRYRCSLTKPETSYPKLTDDLKTLGKGTCSVSNSRYVGTTADKRAFMEVACADGLQGYMIEYSVEPTITPKQVIVCSSAGGIAGGCKLPGNVKG